MEIGVDGFCKLDNEIIFSILNLNGVCKLDIDTMEIQYLFRIKEEATLGKYLYSDIKRIDNLLIFTPMAASNILVYNIEKCEYEAIPYIRELEDSQFSPRKMGAFSSSFLVGRDVYMVPARYFAFIKFNVDSKEITYYDGWISRNNLEINLDYAFTRPSGIEIDSKIFCPSLYYNTIFSIDCMSDECDLILKGKEGPGSGYLSIFDVGEMYILVKQKARKLIKYDKKWNLIWEKDIGSNYDDIDAMGYSNAIKFGEYVYLIPYYDDTIYRFNILSEEIEIFYNGNNGKPLKYINGWIDKDRLFCCREDGISVFSIDTGIVENVSFNRNKSIQLAILHEIISEEGSLFMEGDVLNMDEFIQAVQIC